MTLKEFITIFIEHAEAMGKIEETNNLTDEFIDSYLEYFYKEYYPIGIVKRGSSEGDTLELMNTMEDFKQCLKQGKLKLEGLKSMTEAYNSVCLGPEKISVYMHPEDLELYERWQDENTDHKRMQGMFKGSAIKPRESCTRGWVTFERGTHVVSVSFEFKEEL